MNSVRNDCQRISRRTVLTGTALALGAAAAAGAVPPAACKFVQGDVSPNGWCQLFAPKT